MVTEIKLFESGRHSSLDFCLWGWMQSEVYTTKAVTQYELFARVLDAAVCTQESVDQLIADPSGRAVQGVGLQPVAC